MPHREMLGTVLIMGLGLLGGSAGMAIRSRHLARRITAACRAGHPHEEARRAGLIDDYSPDVPKLLADADLVLLCQPVDSIRQSLAQVLGLVRPGTIVTDVGSTKAGLVRAAEAIDSQGHFVGSHPMAGSHLTGWQNGRPDLFSGATTYVTVTDATDLRAAGTVARFWTALGSRVMLTTPERHDRLAAMLSHVPHMTAASLMQGLLDSGEDPSLVKLLAGNGLRDSTRIAAGSAQVWREICQHNSKEIASQLRALALRLETTAGLLEAGDLDRVEESLAASANLRQKL
jgi:prephenate dehydrogenase